jgi:hydrogenase-4 component B
VIDSALPFLRLTFGFSPLAMPFVVLLGILTFAVALWSVKRGRAGDNLLIGGFALAMLGVLLAQSVAAFFLAWEAMSLVSVFLIAAQHERRAVRRAALTYLVVAQGGALCILAALVVLALGAHSTEFSHIAASAHAMRAPARNAVFVLALLGFGSKAGLVPLHFWLPRAHPVAPPNASAMLSGVMLKIALYGLCLTAFVLAAPAQASWGVVLLIAGTASAILGVLYALVEHDLKRLLAYHSVENVGIITIALGASMLGVWLRVPLLASIALVAALFHSVNHGLFKGLLFLGAGTVAQTQHTADLEKLGGLMRPLAWTAPLFLIGCVAISGLPPLNGFASEWLTFRSLIAALAPAPFWVKGVLIASVAGLALTGGLAAACFVKVFGVAFLGRPRRARPPATEERFDFAVSGIAVLALACVVLGFIPMLAVAPLSAVAAIVLGTAVPRLPALPVLPVTIAVLPIAGAAFSLLLARASGLRRVATWTCGSPVTAAAQYTATAFSKPLRTVFAFLLLPERRRTLEAGRSRWFPERILYRTQARYVVDEAVRRLTAAVVHVTRRSRALQSGSLRLYLVYEVAAFILVVASAR